MIPGEDLAALPYTGGTTGLPKAAMITHRNMVAVQKQTRAFWPILEDGKEVIMAFLPFFHIYGQVVVMLSGLVQGSTMVLFTTPDIEDILEGMERYQATGFFGVPTLFEYLKEYEKTDRVNWKKLKMIVCGADTLHDSTVEAWEKRTDSIILEGYGMTETTSVSHGTPLQPAQERLFRRAHAPYESGHHRNRRNGFSSCGGSGGNDIKRPEYYERVLEKTGQHQRIHDGIGW